MPQSEWVYLEDCTVLGETEKALKVLIEEGRQVWLPKSVIAPDDVGHLEVGDEGVTIPVAEWFADKEGLSS